MNDFLALRDLGDLVEAVIAIIAVLGSAIAGGTKMLRDRKPNDLDTVEAKDKPRKRESAAAPLSSTKTPTPPRQPRRDVVVVAREISGVLQSGRSVAKPPSIASSQTARLAPETVTSLAVPPLPPTDSQSAASPYIQALRHPTHAALRNAIVLSEILGPPLALRFDHHAGTCTEPAS